MTSAALYACWLKATDANPIEFVYLDYHESLLKWADCGPADIYMADFPAAAFPNMVEEIELLKNRDVSIARYEDHHPCPVEQVQKLEALRDRGLIGVLELTGPEPGAEPGPEHMRCGADIVYEAIIAGTPLDSPGLADLRTAAHGEDFVTNRTELGLGVTRLIQAGMNKAELAAILSEASDTEILLATLKAHPRWLCANLREAALADTEDQLRSLYYTVDVLPDSAQPDMEPSRIAVVLAPHPQPGNPRIAIGHAAAYFSRTMPDIDYLFYAYGAALLVTRRLNGDDSSLNLGRLMAQLGGEGDGGHAGAAVCRPEANERFPAGVLGNVEAGRFKAFVRYLADRLTEAGFRVIAIRDHSRAPTGHRRSSARRLAWVAVAALLVGLGLRLFLPAFQASAIRASNTTFYPQLGTTTDMDSEEDAL